ncbi:Nif11 family protein [Bradyrhizobium sp. BR 1432]|uniref:Nif11 family protein n=1 Tax=Bradyrhizobium sp. BR 1432 TaxID=3447966 RepID=UPI003EE58750
MSQTDVEHFVNDLGKKGTLLKSIKPVATGLAPIVAMAKSLDYDFTLDDVKSYIRVDRRQKSREKKPKSIAGRKHCSGAEALSSLVQTRDLANCAMDLPTSTMQVAEVFPSFAAVVLIVVIVVSVA